MSKTESPKNRKQPAAGSSSSKAGRSSTKSSSDDLLSPSKTESNTNVNRSSLRSSGKSAKEGTVFKPGKDGATPISKLGQPTSVKPVTGNVPGKASTETKSALKKKGRSADANAVRNKNKTKVTAKKARAKRKTAFEKMMTYFGYYVGDINLKDPRAIEAVQALDLTTGHLKRLKAKFDQIDIDGSNNIDYEEFFDAMGEERSPFTDKLFSLIDLDGSGTIEFEEFVRVLATYCMFTKDEILRFCFECFDVDKSGSIDEKEFVELCKCINNANPSFPTNFKNALESFDVNQDGLIDYSEFQELDRRYPIVLFPAFRLQDMMQRHTLGERTWLKIIEKYQESRRIEEYKAAHGGRAPPDPPLRAFLKVTFPCLYHERVHIQVGAEMEARHRDN